MHFRLPSELISIVDLLALANSIFFFYGSTGITVIRINFFIFMVIG